MKTSDSIANIAKAIVAAQAAAKGALKDGKNTFFKNAQGQATSYATLDSVIEACKEALSINKLAVIQAPLHHELGFCLETRIQHESGEYYEIQTPILMGQQTMQAFGSAITYAKRYAISSLLNISTDGDDNGDTASKRVEKATDILDKARKSKDPYVFDGGKFDGKRFGEVSYKDFNDELAKYKTVPNISVKLQNLIDRMEKYVKESNENEIK
jgi:hypothetical protein